MPIIALPDPGTQAELAELGRRIAEYWVSLPGQDGDRIISWDDLHPDARERLAECFGLLLANGIIEAGPELFRGQP